MAYNGAENLRPLPPTPPPIRKVSESSIGVIGVIWLSLIPTTLGCAIGFLIGMGL